MELSEHEAEDLSYPRDFLRRFRDENPAIEFEMQVEPELSLGLSLGGCFSVDPREMRLFRSSSTAVLSSNPESPSLARTCSLPASVDADEENRKRKEMQSLKRLEVKRKRTEKRSSSRPIMALSGSSSDFDGRLREESDLSCLSNSSTITSLPETFHKSAALVPPLPPRLRSLNSLHEDDDAFKITAGNLNRATNMGSRNMMDEMPSVSVRGDGPNGKRIEGFLYNYRKGEEVRIVCVCHGNFLTPAEFVKHAGGGDVAHPLRHIVVNPSSFYY